MPRKKIKSKKKFDSYKSMEFYDDLHCILTWMPLTGMEDIDWNNKELIKKLWKWHGKKIMDEWRHDSTNACHRPKIWWYYHKDKLEPFKILRREKYTNLKGEPEPMEIWPDGHLEYDYPIYESEAKYLERLGLLEEWELESLKEETETEFLPYL